MKNRKNIYILFFAIICMGIISVGGCKIAYAATTLHWNGSVSNIWSEKDNWDEGQFPVDGDSLVFISVTGVTSPLTSENDIPDLTIQNITLSEVDYSYISYNIKLNEPLIITGGIYNFTNGKNYGLEISGSITLGHDIEIMTDSELFLQRDKEVNGDGDITNPADVLNLNGHTVTFKNSTNPNPPDNQSQRLIVAGSIIGTGNLVVNNTIGELRLWGENTFDGNTDIIAGIVGNCFEVGGYFVALNSRGSNIFGKSGVHIHNGAQVKLYVNDLMDYSDNIITIYGLTSGELGPYEESDFRGAPIDFYPEPEQTVAIPHIVLNGSTYFTNVGMMRLQYEDGYGIVDLTGIDTNGYTLKFLSYDIDSELFSYSEDGTANGFIFTAPEEDDDSPVDGTKPPVVVVKKADTPAIKAPDTAMSSFVMDNPVATALLGFVSSGSLIIFAKLRLNKR